MFPTVSRNVARRAVSAQAVRLAVAARPAVVAVRAISSTVAAPASSAAAAAEAPKKTLRDTPGTVWNCGEWQTLGTASVPLVDLGLLRGFGIFDFMRTFGGKPFHIDQHLRRLRGSAQAIGLKLEWSDDYLKKIIAEALAKDIKDNGKGEKFVRIMVTGGVTADWITPGDPTLVVIISPVIPPNPDFYKNGVKVGLFPHERHAVGAKTLNYIAAMSALASAKAAGAVESIYFDKRGRLLEGTTSNLFLVDSKGKLVTADEGVLSGITRHSVLRMLSMAEIPVELRDIQVSELPTFKEAFLTASNKMVMPVVQIGDQVIGNGKVGPVTEEIMRDFGEVTRAWGDGLDILFDMAPHGVNGHVHVPGCNHH